MLAVNRLFCYLQCYSISDCCGLEGVYTNIQVLMSVCICKNISDTRTLCCVLSPSHGFIFSSTLYTNIRPHLPVTLHLYWFHIFPLPAPFPLPLFFPFILYFCSPPPQYISLSESIVVILVPLSAVVLRGTDSWTCQFDLISS